MKTLTQKSIIYIPAPKQDRLAIWRKVRGVWKNRKPDPIKEQKKMRREWDRKLPRL